MKDSVAVRYATGLFELACEEHKVDAWQEQMNLLKKVYNQEKDLKSIFTSMQITKQEKKDIIRNIFGKTLDREVINFLSLLVDKGRILECGNIAIVFNTLCNDYKHITEGYVYSTYLLKKEEIARLEAKMSEEYNTTVKLVNEVDESLIRGIKIVIKDKVIDDSMKYKIDLLKENLLKEAG